jgi:hypothetical protein
MEFFNIICTTDNPILDTIFSYYRVNLDIEYQSPLLLVDKKIRRAYIDHIGNSIKMPIDLSKHSLNGIGNFSEKLTCLMLKCPRYIFSNICSSNNLEEIIKLTNLSKLSFDNVRSCRYIIQKLDAKKIKYLSIDNCLSNEIVQYITNNLLNLISLRLYGIYEEFSLKSIKNLEFLEELSIEIKSCYQLIHLSKIKNLKVLHILMPYKIVFDYLSYLGKFKSLISINFENEVACSEKKNRMYIKYICQNNSLTSISLNNVLIDIESLKLLIDKDLEELSLRKCKLYDVFDCLKFLENNIEKIKHFSFDVYWNYSTKIEENNTKIVNYLSDNLEHFSYNVI